MWFVIRARCGENLTNEKIPQAFFRMEEQEAEVGEWMERGLRLQQIGGFVHAHKGSILLLHKKSPILINLVLQ